jgi:hypothetical protein
MAAAAACGGGDDGGGAADNLIENGGFEDGASPWVGRGGPPETSSDQAKSGGASALLRMRDTIDSPTTQTYSLHQDLVLDELPEKLSLDYYVDHWVRGTPRQYIEAAIVVTGEGALLPDCPQGPCPNYQLRYILSGTTVAPLDVANAFFIFSGEEEPKQGEWVHFEANVPDDFAAKWRGLPDTIESVRLLVDVRFDNRELEEGPLEADVYVDDVYFGTP